MIQAAAGGHKDLPDQMYFTASAIEMTIEAAADGEEDRIPTFSMTAYDGGLMHIANFWYPVVADLEGMQLHADTTPILRQHDPGKVVGHADNIDIRKKVVKVNGHVSGVGEDAKEVVECSKRGFKWQASIGASAQEIEFYDKGETVTVNGQKFDGPVYVARKSTLLEVSFVTSGGNKGTKTKIAANAAGSTKMNFEQWLEERGFDINTITAQQRTSLQAAYDAEVAASADPPPSESSNTPAASDDNSNTPSPVDQLRAEMAAETERVAMIRTLCAGNHATIEANAIREGWDQTRVELEVMRAERPSAPMINTGAGSANINQMHVLEAALAQAGGVGESEIGFGPEVLQAAHTAFRGRVGLQETLLEAARINGHSGYRFRGHEREILQAAFSTNDISGILSNTANKFLLMGFEAVESAWRQIAAIRNVKDFKTVTSFRLTGGLVYEQVGPTGELKHGTLGEESYTNKADTYGSMLAITRQDIINDDLDALTAVPRRLGRGGALKLNLVFWEAFLANAAFFTAGNNNFIEGAATALGIDSLTQAETMFLNQVDSDDNPLAITPEILLVPNALKTQATLLMESLELRDTTASKKTLTKNPHAGNFKPVASSYLSSAALAGSSANAWYLLANPQDMPTIEVAFLNGNQSPTVESADADFNTLGIQMRGYHDFGVALQEFRGGVKSRGEAGS